MSLRDFVELVASRPGRGEATCESCGAEFECGAGLKGCWCAEVTLDDAAREELRGRFRRCLCRACLEAYAARGAEGGAPDAEV